MTGRKEAFTLIELLAVIGIIALLAAILVPTLNIAIQKAKVARARTEVSNIASAIKAYYGDYGKMPAPGRNGMNDYDYGGKSISDAAQQQNKVMAILRGIDVTNNPNRTVYLSVNEDSMEGTDRNGKTYTRNEGYFLDPWGTPYHIIMDTDFDGVIKFSLLESPFSPGAGWNNTEIKGQISGVVCYGPPPHSFSDIISSWGGKPQ